MSDSPPPAQETELRKPSSGFRTGMWVGAAAVLVLGAVILGIGMLLQPMGPAAESAAEQAAAIQARADQEQAQAQALRGQLAAADAELAVERSARRALEDNLTALQAQAGQLRDRLAFYDQLFPAGPAGTVSIRAVEVARVPSGLRYRVLLMRSARPGLAPFIGGLQFIATGMRDGNEVKLALSPLQTMPVPGNAGAPASTTPDLAGQAEPTALAPAQVEPAQAAAGKGVPGTIPASQAGENGVIPLEVDQYRSSEGILALPPGFMPTEVAVNVVQNGAVLAAQQAVVAF
jgi:hypothetical protein